jgi:uncharacterized protein YecE (DUF72 family)
MHLRIGGSGWEYKHWRGDFYPSSIARASWFEYYSGTFDTVEINNTFYRLPERRTFRARAARAPRGFVYGVKASRILTHMKKLKIDTAWLEARPWPSGAFPAGIA